MNLVLESGLQLRDGQREFQLDSLLEDGTTWQVKDLKTGRISTLDRLKILKGVWTRRYHLVVPDSDYRPATSTEGPDEVRVDLGSLKETIRDGIERRLEYLGAMQKGHVSRGKRIEKIIVTVATRLKDPRPPSAGAVMDWARAYEKSRLNPLSLRDGNSCRVSSRRLCDTMERLVSRAIRRVFLTRRKFTLQHTLDVIQRQAKKLVAERQLQAAKAQVSLATLSRRVQEIDLFRRISARDGPERARMLCRTVMGGAGAAYPLQRVEIDHTPLNWVVLDDKTHLPLGRPLLTAAIDAHSNYLLGMYLSFYGAGISSVSGVIRNSVMPKEDFVHGVKLDHAWLAEGIADMYLIDNGLEFHSHAFKLMAWELAADLMYCKVRTPWLKPHIERFFATLNYLTLVSGRIHKRVAGVMNLDPRKDAAIMFSDLVKGLIMFAVDVHPFVINTRKLARPYDLFSDGLASCPPVSYPGDLEALKLTSAMSKELMLGPGGIELHGLPYGREELLSMHHRHGTTFKALVKWDPDNMAYLWIRDPVDLTWIQSPCRWPDYATGLSWNQHLVIRKFARVELKLSGAYEHLMMARLRLADHWADSTIKKSPKEALRAAQAAGVTSARVMASPAAATPTLSVVPTLPADIARIVTRTEAASNVIRLVPTFEAFEMG